MQQEINIQLGAQPPAVYFQRIANQIENGKFDYGGISSTEQLHANLEMHCIPRTILMAEIDDYSAFLVARRRLMAGKIRRYYGGL